jgi:predicted DNA binding protein
MWYLKFKLKHDDCIFAPLVEKYDLSIEFFPLKQNMKGNSLYTSAIHIAKGDEKNIKKYLRDLKKSSRVIEMEVSKEIIFTLTKEATNKESYEAIYNTKILYITPGYNTPDGYEGWEVASWSRKPLENLIKVMEKAKNVTHFEVLRFEESGLEEVYILQLFPNLPKKQREAIELAYKFGYYKYPKKTNLDKLAKIARVSKQTFQENLKKAESRLMPLLLRK